jgi:general bacterial porin, GBP family
MKVLQLRVAIAFAAACAGSGAFAQSSITIFGRADMGIVDTNNGTTHVLQANSGRYTESRFGLKGNEDLGGGSSALFYLEGGLSINNGTSNQGGALFGRGAFVGLSDKSLGQLTLGRQYVPLFWPLLFADDTGRLRLHTYSATQTIERGSIARISAAASPVTGTGSLDASAGGIYTLGITSAFENNQIIYKTASFGGATATLSYGTGLGNASSVSAVKNDGVVIGGNLEWRPQQVKDLYLGFGYNEKKGQRTITGNINEQKLTEWALTGQWVAPGGFSPWGNYHPFDLKSGPQELKGHDWMLGLSWRMPSGLLWANYSAKSVKNCVSCGAKGAGLGYHYHLSNRSELYAFYSRISNQANSALALGGVNPGAVGQSPSSVGAGVAHQF